MILNHGEETMGEIASKALLIRKGVADLANYF